MAVSDRRRAHPPKRTAETDPELARCRQVEASYQATVRREQKARATRFLIAARKGYTQREIADAAGLSVSTVHRHIVEAEEGQWKGTTTTYKGPVVE